MSDLLLQLLELVGGGRAAESMSGARAASLNAKILALLHHLGVPDEPVDELPPGVAELWQAGKQVQEVCAYRDATGLGLKESRDRLRRGSVPPVVALEQNADRLLAFHGLTVDTPSVRWPPVLDEGCVGSRRGLACAGSGSCFSYGILAPTTAIRSEGRIIKARAPMVVPGSGR